MYVYKILLLTQIIISVPVFFLLFFLTAPYGRYYRKGWGLSFPARWAWIIMESPAVFMILFIYLFAPKGSVSFPALVFLGFWELHYVHRTFLYPFFLPSRGRPFPVLLVFFAMMFNCMNGFINGYRLFHIGGYGFSWLTDPRFLSGASVFLCGFWINVTADAEMRKQKARSPDQYIIPTGGLYSKISSPNYLGEIMEWSGFALMTWSAAGLAFMIFTIANLLPRALANHRWYRSHFKNYPAERKALIPFLL